MNCAAPDQPNMISLLVNGTEAQKQTYLWPLANGDIRSCFAMTEPHPAPVPTHPC
jgi:acyl-CoA dehydrogenase